MIPKIIFNNNYPKLWGQSTARLLSSDITLGKHIKESKLYEYDCKKDDGTLYELDDEQEYLILYFIGEQGIPFTTIRKNTKENKKYYDDNFGMPFLIEIKK